MTDLTPMPSFDEPLHEFEREFLAGCSDADRADFLWLLRDRDPRVQQMVFWILTATRAELRDLIDFYETGGMKARLN